VCVGRYGFRGARGVATAGKAILTLALHLHLLLLFFSHFLLPGAVSVLGVAGGRRDVGGRDLSAQGRLERAALVTAERRSLVVASLEGVGT